MKKKIFLILMLCSGIIICNAQSSHFRLEGQFVNKPLKKVYIAYNSGKKGVKDSATVVNSRFSFEGNIDNPVLVFFSESPLFRSSNKILEFFIEASKTKLKIQDGSNFNNYSVSGSETQEQKKVLDERERAVITQSRLLESRINIQKRRLEEYNGNAEKRREIQGQIDSLSGLDKFLSDQRRKIQIQFFDEYPRSYVTLYRLSNYRIFSQDSLQLYFNRMTGPMRNSIYGKTISEQLSRNKIVAGSIAPNFKTLDYKGKEISLQDYKGKNYVLLDFWASWCVPCRENHPELLNLYAKYKDKGLEIIGVSDDVGHIDNWKLAISQDKIGEWRHVLRGTGKDVSKGLIMNDISRLYNVHILPSKILIDKEGRVIEIINPQDHHKLSAVLSNLFP